MSDRRADRRRTDRRAFRPALDARLEERVVQSRFGAYGYLYAAGHIQTAANGQAVDITTPSGQSFYINVAGGGVVQAYHMSNGRYGLKLLGTNNQSVVTINPVIDSITKRSAHTFNTRQAQYNGFINIGAISISTGQVNDIEGYKTAILSGPLVAYGSNPIDRIAFDALAPGATIITGGDLNTLDLANGAVLSGPNTGIYVGRNLNFFSTFGDVDVANGANIVVGGDSGFVSQPAKGTGPSSIPANALSLVGTTSINSFTGYQAAAITGNIYVAPGSQFLINGTVDAAFNVSGTFTGLNNFHALGLRLAPAYENNGSIALLGNNLTATIPAAVRDSSGNVIAAPPGIYPINFVTGFQP